MDDSLFQIGIGQESPTKCDQVCISFIQFGFSPFGSKGIAVNERSFEFGTDGV